MALKKAFFWNTTVAFQEERFFFWGFFFWGSSFGVLLLGFLGFFEWVSEWEASWTTERFFSETQNTTNVFFFGVLLFWNTEHHQCLLLRSFFCFFEQQSGSWRIVLLVPKEEANNTAVLQRTTLLNSSETHGTRVSFLGFFKKSLLKDTHSFSSWTNHSFLVVLFLNTPSSSSFSGTNSRKHGVVQTKEKKEEWLGREFLKRTSKNTRNRSVVQEASRRTPRTVLLFKKLVTQGEEPQEPQEPLLLFLLFKKLLKRRCVLEEPLKRRHWWCSVFQKRTASSFSVVSLGFFKCCFFFLLWCSRSFSLTRRTPRTPRTPKEEPLCCSILSGRTPLKKPQKITPKEEPLLLFLLFKTRSLSLKKKNPAQEAPEKIPKRRTALQLL